MNNFFKKRRKGGDSPSFPWGADVGYTSGYLSFNLPSSYDHLALLFRGKFPTENSLNIRTVPTLASPPGAGMGAMLGQPKSHCFDF